jgi:DNA-binding IclR family transcriptional regulator
MHLERLTLILEIVGQKGEATVADLCAHADLPKPTAYRLVQDLVGAGLLEPVARGRFALGARLRRIARGDGSDRAVLDVAAPVLRRAAAEHGVAFFLARLRGRAVEIIHVETPDTGVSFLHPGLGKRPLHACSCSKAVAAFAPDILRLAELDGRLKAYTEFTLTRREDLEAELDRIRSQGYAECVEELERGICSVAATLGRTGAAAAMAIGAAGSTRVFTPQFRAAIGAEMLGMAGDLAADLLGPGEARALVPETAPRALP